MYKVFINDKVLILRSSKEALMVDESLEIEHYSCTSCMNRALAKLNNTNCEALVLIGNDLNGMWADFCSRYKLIDAAGGLLLNEAGELLWIKRNDKWDLPKGKVEKGEAIEVAAVREVEEECAVVEIDLGILLGQTYHTYLHKGESVLKTTYWYAMSTFKHQDLKPQLEEGITEVVWADKQRHQICVKDTYTSIAELLKREKVQRYLGS